MIEKSHHAIANQFQIICTVGPACEAYYTLSEMRKAGMTAARLNLSHYELESSLKAIRLLRQVDPTLPIVSDLKGPELRIKNVAKPLRLKKGGRVSVSLSASKTKPYFSRTMAEHLETGDIVSANTGSLLLTVQAIKGQDVVLSALNEGFLASNKSANVVNKDLPFEFVTQDDREAIAFSHQQGLEILSVSHVTCAEDVRKIRQLSENMFVAAKIENRLALQNVESIARGSDALWIDRGDLTTSIPIEHVAEATTRVAKASLKAKKPLWVATHILDSMITHSIPTCSNVTDIAFMLNSGATGLVLAGETAVGKYPIQTIEYARRIVNSSNKK